MNKAKKMSQANKPQKSLDELLTGRPELKAKLIEAIETDHFFITVSCQKKRNADETNDLQHYRINHNYPGQDVVNTLNHIKREFMARHMPNDLADDGPGGAMH
jgi:hypothetical protein